VLWLEDRTLQNGSDLCSSLRGCSLKGIDFYEWLLFAISSITWLSWQFWVHIRVNVYISCLVQILKHVFIFFICCCFILLWKKKFLQNCKVNF